jgi:hypothetical protein
MKRENAFFIGWNNLIAAWMVSIILILPLVENRIKFFSNAISDFCFEAEKVLTDNKMNRFTSS